jgi:phosphohistidine phosphatase
MKLYILRHGDAVEHGDPRYKENDRPLTQKGVERTKELAHALREMEIEFDAIVSSPLVRAKETAEFVARGLKFSGKVDFTDHLAPSGSMEDLVNHIHMLRPDTALLVGHEPYLSSFISLLCTGGTGLPIVMKKGGLCRLNVESLRCEKCATLEWLLPPRVIGLKPSRR